MPSEPRLGQNGWMFVELLFPENRGPGLSESELSRAQAEAEVTFPPDLCELLTATLPTGKGFPDWRSDARRVMEEWRENLVRSFLSDLEKNEFWPAAWGELPADANDARPVIAEKLAEVPALIPIYMHRAIPNEPLERGNPVFSFYQPVDTIVYGVDLEDYLRREFATSAAGRARPLSSLGRPIRFWTDLL